MNRVRVLRRELTENGNPHRGLPKRVVRDVGTEFQAAETPCSGVDWPTLCQFWIKSDHAQFTKARFYYILTFLECLIHAFCSRSWNEWAVINSTHKIRHDIHGIFASKPVLSGFFFSEKLQLLNEVKEVLYWPVKNILRYSLDLLKLQV